MFDMNQIKRNVGKWGHGDDNEQALGDSVESAPAPAAAVVREPRVSSSSKEPATIGASICFKGDLSGEEDFVIQGQVEGTIDLRKNNLTIGRNGRIRANITANTIIVEGELRGDLLGNENVIIRKTGNVLGNIVSPRVTLEDGAKFKGSIEMEPKAVESVSPTSRAATASGTQTRGDTKLDTPIDSKGAQQ